MLKNEIFLIRDYILQSYIDNSRIKIEGWSKMDIRARRGDSFWLYSQLFNLPIQLIVDSNRTIQQNQLQIGQNIQIPGFVASVYEIKAGDSLWSIAARRNLPVYTLLLTNSNLDSYRLQIGQSIRVPLRITWKLVNGNREYDFQNMKKDLNRLENVYPFIRISSIGKSVLKNDIPEILIGHGSKRVHYNGSFHANEWITTPIIMTFLNDYLLSITNQTPIRGLHMNPFYRQTLLSIVPMVNPDGVNLVLNGPPSTSPWNDRVIQINHGKMDFSAWKANIRGFDLNNQFPANWEFEKGRKPKQPEPRDYPGSAPLSEPESQAMAALTRTRDFSRVLAFHTQGEVIYWGYENLEPPVSKIIVQEFGRVSGYEPVQSIDSHAGYKDWFIQEWRRPGYTIELGKGVNPLPLSQFNEIYQESLGIMLAGLYM